MRKEIQEHFDRLDREVVNINNEAARNYLALNDKMNDVLQAVVELKNLIRQEEGGTPLMSRSISAEDMVAAAHIPIMTMEEALEELSRMLHLCTPDIAPEIAKQMCEIYRMIKGI